MALRSSCVHLERGSWRPRTLHYRISMDKGCIVEMNAGKPNSFFNDETSTNRVGEFIVYVVNIWYRN